MYTSRFLHLVLVAMLAVLVVIPPFPAIAATDRLPDLGMARLTNIQIENPGDGRRLLRFSATIVNVGVGSFEVHAKRASTTGSWALTQRLYDDAGSFRSAATAGNPTLVFGGDGHNHWHVNNLQRYELTRLDNGVKVGTGAKSGFCFFDNVAYQLTLPNAPQAVVYDTTSTAPIRACGQGQSSTLALVMGLSVGWGDKYSASLPDQYIDITGLKSGRYRLRATADPDRWFKEASTGNNVTYVDIQLKGNKVSVVGYGPSA